MRITIFGAAGEVTGSCYLVETDRARVLVDMGMFQGGQRADRKNRAAPDIDAPRLDGVLLTHAHLDHCGRLPMLPAMGFSGPIHCTQATAELTRIILEDSARLQEADAERMTRRLRRAGRPGATALYSPAEVERTLQSVRTIEYGEAREVAPGVSARCEDAGHILGSASIELRVREDGREKVVVFSGDIGPRGAPLMRDPARFERADLAFLESTYGDRDHRALGPTVDELAHIVRTAHNERGRVLIPTFAVARAQQILFHLGQLEREGLIQRVPVYLDSPMAIDATDLYRRHRALFDEEAQRLIDEGRPLLSLPNLTLTRAHKESVRLNGLAGPLVIMAGSGMCDGGRIMHHLKHGLWREDTQVVIVGYQSEGTLGRKLVDGARRVRVMGAPIAVKARIHTLGGFSAHAGRSDLLWWAEPLAASDARFVLTHGEARGRQPLAAAIGQRWGVEALQPELGAVVEV